MGLFNRKNKEESMLPDLPESPNELPQLPNYEQDMAMQNDNSFQNSIPPAPEDKFNQQHAIKNEIHNYSQNNFKEKTTDMQKSSFQEIPRYDQSEVPSSTKIAAEPYNFDQDFNNSNQIIEPRTMELPERSKLTQRTNTKQTQPIYIRLDKFKESIQAFDEVKQKITEIEDLLTNIREIKQKEEQELNEWENEIQIVKARIEQIDSSVFKNVE